MKKFSKAMLASINANRNHTVVEQKNNVFEHHKRDVQELEKFGVTF